MICERKGNTIDAQLDYAPPFPWRRRRKIRRRILLALLLLAAICLAPTIWSRSRILWYQRQCLNYTPPANQVVYDDSAIEINFRNGPGKNKSPYDGAPPISIPSRVQCWDRLLELGELVWKKPTGTVLYLHAGRNASGVAGLIAVELNCRNGCQLNFDCWFLGTDTPYSFAHRHANAYTFPIARDAVATPLRLYAGQPDPADPSRFTIRYDLGGQSGTIEGWVEKSGAVFLEVKDGPALRKPH